jgi:hypothetical protein
MIMKNIIICTLLLVVLSAFNSVWADPLPAPTDSKKSMDGFYYIAQERPTSRWEY